MLDNIEHHACRIAHPLRIVDGVPRIKPIALDVDIEGVMISTVKPADDDSGDIIVRLWESRGGRAMGTLGVPGVTIVSECDALEIPNGEAWRTTNGSVQLTFNAFQIRTLRLSR